MCEIDRITHTDESVASHRLLPSLPSPSMPELSAPSNMHSPVTSHAQGTTHRGSFVVFALDKTNVLPHSAN